MQIRFFATLGCMILAFSASPPLAMAQEPAEFAIDVNGWAGGAFPVPGTSDFSHCAIEHTYENDVTLAFLMNDEGRLAVGVGRPDWVLDDARTLPMQVSIDGSEPVLITAQPASDKLLIIPLGDDPAAKTEVRRGNKMSLTSELITQDFPLTGTSKAINALTACVEKAIEIAKAAPAPSRMSAEMVARLLDSAGINGIALASPEEIKEAKLPIEQSWRIGPLRGALHQEERGENPSMEAFMGDFVAEFEALCPGPFSSVLQPSEEYSGQYALKTGLVTCEGEDVVTHTELVAVLDDSFYTAFVHEGLREDSDTVSQINTRLTQMLRSMITGEPQETGDGAGKGSGGSEPEATAE